MRTKPFYELLISLPIHFNAFPIFDERFINILDHVFATEEAISRQNCFDFIFDLISCLQDAIHCTQIDLLTIRHSERGCIDRLQFMFQLR